MRFIRKHPIEVTKINTYAFSKRLLKSSCYTRSTNIIMHKRGTVIIKILENCRLQYKQLESIRKFFLPYTKKIVKIWFNGNFTTALTKKAIGTRMGKGKGKLSHWVSLYKKGQVIVEFENLQSELLLSKLLRLLKHRLPFKYTVLFKKI